MTAAEDRWAKPTLVGVLVTLRPYSTDDGEAVWEMVNDPEGRALTGTTASFTREQIHDWVASRPTAPERLDLAIVENATGEFSGEVVINEFDREANSANLRIVLRGPAWFGRGLGGEATEIVVGHSFESVLLDTLTLDVRDDNLRAIRAYESAGFARTGDTVADGHTWVDMELTRERWEARR